MDLFDIIAGRQGDAGGGSSVVIDQKYNPQSQNAQSGIAVKEALETIVKDLEEIPLETVDKWEYNKFYKIISPGIVAPREYVFDDGTSDVIDGLLSISIVVKYKQSSITPGVSYEDVIYNFDGKEARTVVIDPVNKTIRSNSFIPIDESKAMTEINETATNNQYPTALAVKNYIDTVIGGIENGSY